ncbi:MAG: OmpA family protein [Balneolaceae bacterium]
MALLLSANAAVAQSADELYNSGKYIAAAAAYERAATNNAVNYKKAAMSYTATKEWDKAIRMYELYSENYSGANKSEIKTLIDILKAPEEELFIENIGENINSNLDEFLPRVSADGERLYFYSTDRAGGYGGGDVWYSQKKNDGSWDRPQSMGPVVNTDTHEGILSISSDGNTAIVFGNYEGRFGGGDFFYSAKVGDSWTVPCNLGGDVNSKNWESMANLSPDGKTLIFVAYNGRKTEEEADYKTDIYITHLQNGRWTTPKTISSVINTSESETWPSLNADGRTLYFSSNGHPGLGEKDLFMTKRIGEGWDQWTTPVNLGKNVNSVLSDEDLTIPASGTVAYFTRVTTGEGDGFGQDDIFRMILPNELRPEPVVSIFGEISNQKDSLIAATLFWSDYDSGEELGYATSSRETGDYYITLPYGRRYLITANQKGYLFKTEMLDLRTQEEDTAAFSEKIGAELSRMRSALTRIESNHNSYENLLASNSANLKSDFENLAGLSTNMNLAQMDLNESIRRARINWLEGNSGYKEVQKDIQLTEASEGAKLVLRNIYFDTGSANLRSESEQELDRLYEIMEKSRLVVEIGGHTDDVGSDQINKDLSQARAESVVRFIIGKGISSDRISAKGYGETEPIADNTNEEGRQENRRVEVKVLSSGMEGTGGLVDQREVVEEETSSENLYELYRAAAKAGGLPSGAACYEESNSYASTRTTSTNTRTNNSGSRRSTNVLSVSTGDAALGNGGISFLTHSGGGAHGFTNHSGMGVALLSGKANGERSLWGYFMGGTYGGGIEWIRYNDLSGKLNMPLSLDYGLGVYGTITSTSTDNGVVKSTAVSASLGAPVVLRLRYNMELASIKLSPYAAYNYNLLKHVTIDPSVEVKGNEVISTAVATPSWMELGARAKWSFLSAGIGMQFSEGNSGMMFRAGIGF